MLFNSYEFLFAFFPVTLLAFLLFGRHSKDLALGWLIVASLFFYAWWRPMNVFIIGPSIAVNYFVARGLLKLTAQNQASRANALLIAGIAFNIAFLGYFKYTNFVKTALNDFAGTDFVLGQLILPLGISFITFQKIAFLVDVHGGRVGRFSVRDFCLFVLFFPQLIAGPIVHFREMMPQFQDRTPRSRGLDVAVGLTLFTFGLFKKVVLADGIAAHVTPLYDAAAGGEPLALFAAWVAALGFTLQIYFDFSGYTDMAIGLARCMGIRLPPNFESPLKASSIIDFWLRWHMTLTRFLTAYLYNPLVLWLTRRRLAKGGSPLAGRRPSLAAFASLLAGPTLFTMFVSGVWHGAGYTFVLWGLLHGVYLVVNHAWRRYAVPLWKDRERYRRVMQPVGWCLTFLAVAVAMVLFRAPTVEAAAEVLRGLVGLNGIAVPADILARLGLADRLAPFVTADETTPAGAFVSGAAWVVALLAIALLAPNTREIMSRYEPVLGSQDTRAQGLPVLRAFKWSPSAAWLAIVGAISVSSVLHLGGLSEFLYWQF